MRRVRIPSWAISIGVVAVLVGVVGGAGLVLRADGMPLAGGSPATGLPTPAGTGIVARLPLGQGTTFAWSPDGTYLLVSGGDQYVSRVYDRFGRLVSQFGSIEGWLDPTRLIDGSGYVADVATSHTGGPKENSWVVASGHGSAAIIVAVPGCTGDPLIDWYKNGGYVKADEKATPYGWSPDGRLLLLGHMSCSSEDAELHGWKGPVDVIDFATGHVQATAPDVRGDMAFNPSATRLAADSDNNLEILDVATGKVKTVQDAQLLGWTGDDSLYCLTPSGSLAIVGATASIPDFGGIVVAWSVPSSNGPELEVDATGRALRVASADEKTTLLDLSSTAVDAVRHLAATGQPNQPRLSFVQPRLWSPDGRMLVIESADGATLDLISVDPAQPAVQ
jgi:WD40 repeat protein